MQNTSIFTGARDQGLLEEWQLVMYGTEHKPGVPFPDANDRPFVPGQKEVRCHIECLEGCTGPGAHECISCKNYRVIGENKVSEIGPCSDIES